MKEQGKELVAAKEEILLSVKEAAIAIEESPGVVRNWLRELKGVIPAIVGEHGYRYFDPHAMEVLEKIKKLRNEDKLSLREIEDVLIDTTPQVSQQQAEVPSEKLLEELKNTKEQLELQINFNSVLVQQLKKQQEQMDQQHEFIETQKEQIAALNAAAEQQYLHTYGTRKSKNEVKEETKEMPVRRGSIFRLFSYR